MNETPELKNATTSVLLANLEVNHMTDKNKNKEIRTKHADTIIRNHVIWSMGAGLIPVLIADIFAVSALQLDMIRQLCKVYDIDNIISRKLSSIFLKKDPHNEGLFN